MVLQWKDKSYCTLDGEDPYEGLSDEEADKLYNELRELGIGNYIQIEVDLVAKTAKVVRDHR